MKRRKAFFGRRKTDPVLERKMLKILNPKEGKMVSQNEINGKPKQVFIKHGHEYTRKGYDLRVETANKFAKKCDLLGETEGHTIEKLVEFYLMATGWEDRVKQSPVFEPDNNEHIRQAVRYMGRSELAVQKF